MFNQKFELKGKNRIRIKRRRKKKENENFKKNNTENEVNRL